MIYLKHQILNNSKVVQKTSRRYRKNPILGKRFTEQQLKDIKAGNPRPEGLTWHHNEKKGVMELVDQEIHAKQDIQGVIIYGEGYPITK